MYSRAKEMTNPEKGRIQVEQKPKTQQKASVVYYLSRNGKLEHPHFIEVPLSSPRLYLRDVMSRLNFLRGQGMANTYFWSSKRSYKNAFVWQDLSENDIIYPCHGNEYILKGSQLEKCLSFRSYETRAILSDDKNSSETTSSSEDSSFPAITRRKNHSMSTLDDLVERKIIHGMKGTDVSTQTDNNNRQRRLQIDEEISTQPPSFASEAVVGTKDSLKVHGSADIRDQTVESDRPSRRIKVPMVLMKLIACGSNTVKDSESLKSKD